MQTNKNAIGYKPGFAGKCIACFLSFKGQKRCLALSSSSLEERPGTLQLQVRPVKGEIKPRRPRSGGGNGERAHGKTRTIPAQMAAAAEGSHARVPSLRAAGAAASRFLRGFFIGLRAAAHNDHGDGENAVRSGGRVVATSRQSSEQNREVSRCARVRAFLVKVGTTLENCVTQVGGRGL